MNTVLFIIERIDYLIIMNLFYKYLAIFLR